MPDRIGDLTAEDLNRLFRLFLSISTYEELVNAIEEEPLLSTPTFQALIREQHQILENNSDVPPDLKKSFDSRYHSFFVHLHAHGYMGALPRPEVQSPSQCAIVKFALSRWLEWAHSKTEVALALIAFMYDNGLLTTVREALRVAPEALIVQRDNPEQLVEALYDIDDEAVVTLLDPLKSTVMEAINRLPTSLPCLSVVLVGIRFGSSMQIPALHRCFIEAGSSLEMFDLVSQTISHPLGLYRGFDLSGVIATAESPLVPMELLAADFDSSVDSLLAAFLICRFSGGLELLRPPPLTKPDANLNRVLEVRSDSLLTIAKQVIPLNERSDRLQMNRMAYSEAEFLEYFQTAHQLSEEGLDDGEFRNRTIADSLVKEFATKYFSGTLTIDRALELARDLGPDLPEGFKPLVSSGADTSGDPRFAAFVNALAEALMERRDHPDDFKALLAAQCANGYFVIGEEGLAMSALARAEDWL